MEGGLLKTRQCLEIYHPIPQKEDILRAMVDMVVCHLPLLGEDDVVLLDGVFNFVGCRQHLLSMLLRVGLYTTDLCCMGSPLYLSIVHLQKGVRRT